jgi:hypothetical protein
MKLFKEIKNSIYNPAYYRTVVQEERFKNSIKYLAKVSLLASLACAIVVAISLPFLYKTLKTEAAKAVTAYPDDLVVSIKGGTASINKPEPYAIPMLPSWKEFHTPKNPAKESIIVIDTTKAFNLDDFRSYSAYALLTKTDLILPKDPSGGAQIIPLAKVHDVVITKALLLEKEAKLITLLPALMVFILACAYVGFFILNFIGTLIMLLIFACFIWLLAKAKGEALTYKKAYQVGLHASTIVLFLNILGLFISALSPFFIKLVAILLIVYINLYPDMHKANSKE